MPVVFAVLLSVWAAWRWVGLAAGALRVGRFEHEPARREALRQVVTHGAFTVFITIAGLVAWAWTLDLQLTEAFGGFVGAALMVSLSVGVASRFMQPAIRTPETLDVCRLRPREHKDPVRPIGSVLETDEHGYLVPEVASEKIVAPWDDVVEVVRSALVRNIAERLHSVYVRGSVAHGTAIEGISDLDMIAIVDASGPVDMSWFEAFERGACDRFGFIAGVECQVASLPDVQRDGGHNVYGFLLAVTAVCVHGPDLREELPRFRIGRSIPVHSRDLTEELAQAVTDLDTESPEERRETCAWIMKRIVRAGFEIVMLDEGVWTRDLYPCFDAFARHHPERAEEMRKALELAVAPTEDVERITRVCTGIGAWVAEEGRDLVEYLDEADPEPR